MTAGRSNSSRSKSLRRVVGLLLALAALTALLPGSQATAATRLEVPEEAPGGPFYAHFEAPRIAPHTDQWAAIVFYRDPACVPSGFNLLSFFDVPRAFACPLTAEGFEIWENGPGQDPAPLLSKRHGGPVPVWFVAWPELQAAAADSVVTIAELRALPSLIIGHASRFSETLRPSQSIHIGARGHLSDGRTFKLQVVAHATPRGTFEEHVAIRFG